MAKRSPALSDLRRFAIHRSLFTPTNLARAIERLGFVQADPIRAPARAQDLILRHRVRHYRVADLERHYPTLEIEEDYFVNYGFLPRRHSALLHPRSAATSLKAVSRRQAAAMLQSIQERGELHPRQALEHDRDGRVANYWGGQSRATTHLLDQMHYGGLLRVARRDKGIRVYAQSRHALNADDRAGRRIRADALIKLMIELYAPLPAETLTALVAMLRRASPRLRREVRAAVTAIPSRYPHARVAGTEWYWPAEEEPTLGREPVPSGVRLLAPFDPVVWDRRRFEQFWGWAYRFEAYVPAASRQRGYYALPLLWGERVIGWGNLSLQQGKLVADIGYVAGRAPKGRRYREELTAEMDRMASFLGAGSA